jgi:hypothetical protein
MQKLFQTLMAVLLAFVFCNCARGQSTPRSNTGETPRYEVGGQIFTFVGRDLGYGWGAGGRFTYNVNKYVALDNEVNLFLPDEGPPYATQGLFGVKVGKRIDKVGIFAKARPGFQTNLYDSGRDQTRFALDVGVVSEYYPNKHLVLRFDAGDVIIPFRGAQSPFVQGPGTTHNLQVNLGLGVRF